MVRVILIVVEVFEKIIIMFIIVVKVLFFL